MLNHSLFKAFQVYGSRLFTVANDHPDAEISVIPGWSMGDLVSHIGVVYGAVKGVISADQMERPSVPFPTPPEDGVHNWARNNFHELQEVFASREPDHPIWTWGKEQTVGWFLRRMTHETLVHMWDAETAADEHISVDGGIAADGVNEFIDGPLQFSVRSNREFSYPDGSIHLHRIDGEGEWLLQPSLDGLSVRYVHEKGDVAVRGSSMDLLLYLWRRHPEALETFGPDELVAEWGQQAP